MIFESECFAKTGIVWETHTLCKRHAYSLCDAHGGAVKRAIRRAAVAGANALHAEELAQLINSKEKQGYFANARAYAFKNINRDQADRIWASLHDAPGMKACCEFLYNTLNSAGAEVPTPGVMRMREVSGDSEETPKLVVLSKST